MKPDALRAIVERMTTEPWYPRGRLLSRVPDNTGMGATLHGNHIATVAEPDDATGTAALRNHTPAWIALQDAVGRLGALRDGAFTGAQLDSALDEVMTALAALEALP